MSNLRVRNAICDFYFSTLNPFNVCKYGRARLLLLKKAYPVLRIFGILDSGKKCCAHIHGCLPYVIIRTRIPLNQNLRNYLIALITECADRDVFQFQNNCPSKLQWNEIVYGIFEERGSSIYGYHESKEVFLKIYFFNPLFAKTFSTVLQKGFARSEWLQPYNTHIPFTLQFFIDFSLHGMDYVHFYNVYHRKRLKGSELVHRTLTSPLTPVSHCAVEFDVYTDDIVNPMLSKEGCFQSSGLNFIWHEEQQRCEILKMAPPKADRLMREEADGIGENDESISKWREEFEDILEDLEEVGIASLSDQNGQQPEIAIDFQDIPLLLNGNWNIPDGEVLFGLEAEDSSNLPFDQAHRLWENEQYRCLGFDVDDDFSFEGNLLVSNRGTGDEQDSKDGEEEEMEGDDEDESTGTSSSNSQDEEGEEESHWREKGGLENGVGNHGFVTVCPREDAPVIRRIPAESSGFNELTVSLNEEVEPVQQQKETPQFPDRRRPPFCPTPRTPLCLESSFHCASSEEEALLQRVQSNVDHLCVLSLEVLAFPGEPSRSIADPKLDPIFAVTFSYQRDICNWQPGDSDGLRRGAILLRDFFEKDASILPRITERTILVKDEFELLQEMAKFILRLDPEILVGYDTKRFSWGYLFERAQALEVPFRKQISRINENAMQSASFADLLRSPFNAPHGRLILETWWNVRKERPLRSYHLGNVAKEVLRMKFPELAGPYLAELVESNEVGTRATLLKYFLRKSALNLQILSSLDLFVRTCQMARVYGIQFEGVLTRGSQFRVESMLLRIAASQRFFAPSISEEQRTMMTSPEFIPLNIEPKAGLYYDPVVVLDFQSLYPSISIAHNYCFSTCLGKVPNYQQILEHTSSPRDGKLPGQIILGATSYVTCPVERLEELLAQDKLAFAPNGAIFVDKTVRMGLVPVLLSELLDTRVMVKNAMKMYQGNQKLLRLLDARQLALKLIANVTYGYTAANWTGRMPCEEVANAIISKGRETLERAILAIDEAPVDKYKGAKVIYGDTDSVFVVCHDSSREEAFLISRQIAEDVTAQNPYPIKLKFEKVMHPCCLMSKKRYLGVAYEDIGDTEGKLDSKGMETVRRDSPHFVARVLEHFLKDLLDKSPIAALRYLEMRLSRLELADLDEFLLSIDYVGGYAKTSKSPANKLGRELALLSDRLTPLYGERLVYVVAAPEQHKHQQEQQSDEDLGSGDGNAEEEDEETTILSNTVTIDKFLHEPTLQLDLCYYLRHQLFPPLERLLGQIPLDVDLETLLPQQPVTEAEPEPAEDTSTDEYLRSQRIRTVYKYAYTTRNGSLNALENLRRICFECVGRMRTVDIEAYSHCSNYSCPINRKASAVERKNADPILNGVLSIYL